MGFGYDFAISTSRIRTLEMGLEMGGRRQETRVFGGVGRKYKKKEMGNV